MNIAHASIAVGKTWLNDETLVPFQKPVTLIPLQKPEAWQKRIGASTVYIASRFPEAPSGESQPNPLRDPKL